MQSGLQILSWSFWSPETREPSEWRAAPPPAAPASRRPIVQSRPLTAVG